MNGSVPSIKSSIRRIAVACLFAIPATGLFTLLMLKLPTVVGIGSAIGGMALFQCGAELKRPYFVGVGGVIMFAGALGWAIQQAV